MDALRADLGSVENQLPPPTWRRLTAEGRQFKQHRSVAPNTLPSTKALMTGKVWPARGGWKLSEDDGATLAEHFRAAGYRTGLFSNNPYVSSEFGRPGARPFLCMRSIRRPATPDCYSSGQERSFHVPGTRTVRFCSSRSSTHFPRGRTKISLSIATRTSSWPSSARVPRSQPSHPGRCPLTPSATACSRPTAGRSRIHRMKPAAARSTSAPFLGTPPRSRSHETAEKHPSGRVIPRGFSPTRPEAFLDIWVQPYWLAGPNFDVDLDGESVIFMGSPALWNLVPSPPGARHRLHLVTHLGSEIERLIRD